MINPPEVTYPLDLENWGKPLDIQQEDQCTKGRINNYITLMLVRYRQKGYQDFDLWEEFREGFEEWDAELFGKASREALKDLRTYLTRHGVWVKRQAGSNSYARILMETLQEDTMHEWTEEEIQEQSGNRTTPGVTRQHHSTSDRDNPRTMRQFRDRTVSTQEPQSSGFLRY